MPSSVTGQTTVCPTSPTVIDSSQWERWLPPTLLAVLRAEQKQAIAHVVSCVTGERNSNELGAVLAFAMGLGKTLITLAVLTSLFNAPLPYRVHRVAIVCPASLIHSWMAEVQKWLPPSNCQFVTLSGRTDMEQFVHSEPIVLVASYDMWVDFRAVFEQHGQPCDMLVVDEAHKCVTVMSLLKISIKAYLQSPRPVACSSPAPPCGMMRFITITNYSTWRALVHLEAC